MIDGMAGEFYVVFINIKPTEEDIFKILEK